MKNFKKINYFILTLFCFFIFYFILSYFDSISNISNDDNIVFLTFDDGPSENTQNVLEILEKKEVLATFFLVGNNLNISNKILDKINYSNHSIGIHSKSHSKFIYNFKDEVLNVKFELENKFNKNVSLFRPGYGYSNPYLNYNLVKYDLDFIWWDIFPKDYEKNSTEILENINKNLKYGSIIVLHDTSGNRSSMISILPEIIDLVRDNGFEFGLMENYLD